MVRVGARVGSTCIEVLGALTVLVVCASGASAADGWAHYGGSLAGDRYHAPSGITAESVQGLVPAWTYRTGDATDGRDFDGNPSRFVATPILVGDRLVVSTAFNRVIALDPGTGHELWTFDPEVNFSRPYSEMFTSRGVAAWRGPPGDGPCRERVFLGTLDARLIALDAETGLPCTDFGKQGTVDLSAGIRLYWKWDYSLTSPTTVVGDLVVVGSSVGDNGRAELQPGVVRAYDVRNGAQVWSFDPTPRSPDHPGVATWAHREHTLAGAANVWSVISADAERDMAFLPTAVAIQRAATSCGTAWRARNCSFRTSLAWKGRGQRWRRWTWTGAKCCGRGRWGRSGGETLARWRASGDTSFAAGRW